MFSTITFRSLVSHFIFCRKQKVNITNRCEFRRNYYKKKLNITNECELRGGLITTCYERLLSNCHFRSCIMGTAGHMMEPWGWEPRSWSPAPRLGLHVWGSSSWGEAPRRTKVLYKTCMTAIRQELRAQLQLAIQRLLVTYLNPSHRVTRLLPRFPYHNPTIPEGRHTTPYEILRIKFIYATSPQLDVAIATSPQQTF